MNVEVVAGPLEVSLVATMGRTRVVVVQALEQKPLVSQWACYSSSIVSINGHSVNAVNPDFKVGELAAS